MPIDAAIAGVTELLSKVFGFVVDAKEPVAVAKDVP